MAGLLKLLSGLTPFLLLGLVAQQFQINQLKTQLAKVPRSVGATNAAPMDSSALTQVYSQFCADTGGRMENGRCRLTAIAGANAGQVLRDWTRPAGKQNREGNSSSAPAQNQGQADPKASGVEVVRGANSLSCEATKNGASCAPDGSVKCPVGQKVLHRVTLAADGKAVRNHYRCRVQR